MIKISNAFLPGHEKHFSLLVTEPYKLSIIVHNNASKPPFSNGKKKAENKFLGDIFGSSAEHQTKIYSSR